MPTTTRFLKVVLAMVAAITLVAAAQESAPRVYTAGDGVTLPSVVTKVNPQYTQEAKQARIQGTVVLDCVVLMDGAVGNVTVSRSLDAQFGLDQEAVKAARQWRFKPGTKDGKPVAVRVAVELTFTLK